VLHTGVGAGQVHHTRRVVVEEMDLQRPSIQCHLLLPEDTLDITIHSDFDLIYALYNDNVSFLSDRTPNDCTSCFMAKKDADGLSELEAVQAAADTANEHFATLDYLYQLIPKQLRPVLWANVCIEILVLQAARIKRFGRQLATNDRTCEGGKRVLF
jgi:hypothetical protein